GRPERRKHSGRAKKRRRLVGGPAPHHFGESSFGGGSCPQLPWVSAPTSLPTSGPRACAKPRTLEDKRPYHGARPRADCSRAVRPVCCGRFFCTIRPRVAVSHRPMSDLVSGTNRLRSMAVGQRPQERLERHGAAALSDTELLALVLRKGTRGHDVMTLAERMLAAAGSVGALLTWRDADFRQLRGVGRVKALQLVAVMELARRALAHDQTTLPLLQSAEAIAAYCQPFVRGLE